MNKPTPIGALLLYYQPRRKRVGWRSLALTAEKRRKSYNQRNAKKKNIKEQIPTSPTILDLSAGKGLFYFAKTDRQTEKPTKPCYFVP